MIIGVTGLYASGKTGVSSYLKHKGFIHLSFSDQMVEELKKRGVSPSRENIIDVANEMREKQGKDYWAEKLITKIEDGKNYIVESVRNPGEIEKLRELKDFHLLLVFAPDEKRFERLMKRSSSGKEQKDKFSTLEEFQNHENKEKKSSNEASQQLEECAKLAENKIVNDGTLEEFHNKIDSLLLELEGKK